jgi:hypothetical protein
MPHLHRGAAFFIVSFRIGHHLNFRQNQNAVTVDEDYDDIAFSVTVKIPDAKPLGFPSIEIVEVKATPYLSDQN